MTAPEIRYGMGCPHCQGSPEEATRIGPKMKVQTRIVCDTCGCGTPWCCSAQRAWTLWCNRDTPRPYKEYVAKIVRYEGIRQVDVRCFDDVGSFRDTIDGFAKIGWELCGESTDGETHLAVMTRGPRR